MFEDAEMREKLRRAVSGNITSWAEAHNVSRSMVSEIVNGVRPMTKSVADALGYELVRVRRFRRKL